MKYTISISAILTGAMTGLMVSGFFRAIIALREVLS